MKCADWSTRIATMWDAGQRCEREATMHNAFGTKYYENQKCITGCRYSAIVIKSCHNMHMAKRGVTFCTVRVDDAVYEQCRCKAAAAGAKCAETALAVGTSEFLLCKFLAVAKINMRKSLHELVPASDGVCFTKVTASNACGHAWHLLMHSYMLELWPAAFSLCWSQQQSRYMYQHRVETLFAGFCRKDAAPALQPKRASQANVAACVSAPATAAPKGHSRRETWADLTEEEESDNFAAATELWGSLPVQVTTASESEHSPEAVSSTVAEARTASERAGSCQQAAKKTRPAKKVTLAEGDVDVTLIESTRKVWMLTVDDAPGCIVNYDNEFIGSIVDRNDIGAVLVDDAVISRCRSTVLAKVARDLFEDDTFQFELSLCIQNMQKLGTMPIEDLSARSLLSQIQYIMREREGREGKGRGGEGRAGKGREGQGRGGEGREGKGRAGEGREGKGRE